jgi:hypothetical protein
MNFLPAVLQRVQCYYLQGCLTMKSIVAAQSPSLVHSLVMLEVVAIVECLSCPQDKASSPWLHFVFDNQ